MTTREPRDVPPQSAPGEEISPALDVTRGTLDEDIEQFRIVFGAVHEGVVLLDRDGHVLAQNDAARRVLGDMPAEVLGLESGSHDWNLIGEDRRVLPVKDRPGRKTLDTGMPTTDIVAGVRQDGGAATWLLVNAHPLPATLAAPAQAAVVAFSDVTQLKQAEAEVRRLNAVLEKRVADRTMRLEAANAELEAFTYSVSHDLRAPLRAIDGFTEMVIEDAAERLVAEDVEHLQRARAAAQHMSRLIDDLLDLSRSSRDDMRRQDVDLSALAESVVADLRASEPDRYIDFVVAPGLMANADPVLLRTVLSNLLGNAWKFTGGHDDARIEVGVTDAGGERAFFVRDDGAGFDLGSAQHLFGAFQRFHSPDEFEGNGIGLATVKRLVRRHGGHIWAEAEVEKGATFFFTLPAPSTIG